MNKEMLMVAKEARAMKCSLVHLFEAYLIVYEREAVKIRAQVTRADEVSSGQELLSLIALKEGLLPALQTDSVRIPSSEFSGPLLAALNRHIDNAQDEIKKDLRDFRNKLKIAQIEDPKFIAECRDLLEKVTLDRRYKENFEILANVWISEKWIRYAIAFFLCSFFVVVTLAYSFFINGLVPSIEFDDVNECLSATACSKITNSECINIYGSYLCRCPEGTFFVPSGGGQGEGGEKGESKAECKPITEDFCKGSLDPPCDPNASCTNAESGATCSCNAGFKGDGIFCEDISWLPILDRVELMKEEWSTKNLDLLEAVNAGSNNSTFTWLLRNVTVDVVTKSAVLIVVPEITDEEKTKNSIIELLNVAYRLPVDQLEVRFIRLFLGVEALIRRQGTTTFSQIEIQVFDKRDDR